MIEMFSRVVLLSLLALQARSQTAIIECRFVDGEEICSSTTRSSNSVSTTAAAQTTAITDCHAHGTTQFCVKGNGEEVQVLATATGSAPIPTAYTGCHAHGTTEMYCVAPDGGEVEVLAANSEDEHDHAEEGHDHEEESTSGQNCHFHAGIEHCEGGSAELTCERTQRDYNVPLRIGLLFVILVTSAIGVYLPLVLRQVLKADASSIWFTIFKQFGTGIIVATALIHLLTHAQLLFGNECLGELSYEATTTAIAMAGAFIAFLIEYFGHRIANWRRKSVNANQTQNNSSKENVSPDGASNDVQTNPQVSTLASLSHHHDTLGTTHPNDGLSVLILEAGIIFHSLLLGITLVVAGDSAFITLFIVIVFHQAFEGLALGARIASLSKLTWARWIIMPMAFALVTPLGMAIGIGVLNHFNGNDPSTIIALGTLDAVSAGILLWVGLVSMWANDWMWGDLKEASVLKTAAALASLVAGFVLMGLLGKWA